MSPMATSIKPVPNMLRLLQQRPLSVQWRAIRSSQQRCVHIECGVITFATAPRVKQEYLRKAAGPDGEAGTKAVLKVVKPEVATIQSNRSLISHEFEPKWAPDGMLKTLSQHKNVWTTEA